MSTDNNHFYGYQTSGNTGGWHSETLDFADPTLGITVMGQPQVWFAFIFQSNASVQYEGVYVDAVTISKTTGPTCTLSCNATVPASGQVGVPTSFQGSSTPSGCSGSVAYDWDFGDGSAHGNQASVSHTYGAVGTYTWRMTASIAGISCSQTGAISISAPPATTYSYWIPVASHAAGQHGSQWRTDLGVLNVTSSTANVLLSFYAGGNVLTNGTTVAPGAQSILQDVVSMFSYTGSGALKLTSDQPLYVTSRTYNQAASGTFGQDYGGFTPDQGAKAGETFYLPELTEDSAYRANIALTNMSSAPAAATVELDDGSGTKLAQFGVSLAPGQWYQETQPFKNRAGQTNMASGYAKVTVTQGSGVIGSASVIDNSTNDPTTIQMKLPFGGPAQYWLPVASHASGLQGSQWRTDLGVLNVGSSTANLQLNFYAGGTVLSSSTTVAPGAQSILQDVVSQFSYTGSGALEVVSDRPIFVTSRTYNQAPSGTFGQDYDSSTAGQGLFTGGAVILLQLTENAAYRTNIALTNLGPDPAVANVELHDGSGAVLTQYEVDLAPGQWHQDTQPFRSKAGQTNMASGYAKVTVTSGSGVIATASVVDNNTNDPTTILMKRAVGSGSLPPLPAVDWVFTRVAGQIGVTVPTIDSIVSSIRSSGINPLLTQLAAPDPVHRIPLSNGMRFDYGNGTLIRGSTVTGSVTATYSNTTTTANGFTFDYAGAISPNFAVNGQASALSTVNGTVSVSQSTAGAAAALTSGLLDFGTQSTTTTTGDLTINGSGANSTITGNVHIDTSVCAKYPISGTIDEVIGSKEYRFTFTPNCDGTFSHQVNPPPSPSPTPTLGTGQLAFRLTWQGVQDLDLYVKDPAGTTIYYGHRTADGGTLDKDCNAGCDAGSSCASPVENIYWQTAPAGTYSFWANEYANCSASATVAYTLQVLRGGVVVQTQTGSLTASGQDSSHYTYTY